MEEEGCVPARWFVFLVCFIPSRRKESLFLEGETISCSIPGRESVFLFLKVKHKGYIKARETSNEKQGLLFVGSASYHG